MRRLCGVVAGVVTAAVLAAPASAATGPVSIDEAEELVAAQSGGGSNQMFVQLAPPAIKGYGWGVFAYKKSPRSRTLLSITFGRQRASQTQSQTSEFRWDLPRTALRMASDLKPTSLVTRSGMGNNGFVDMRLTHTEQHMRVPAGEGCTGAVSIRVGRFGGRFRFNARDEYFKRISLQGVRAIVFREHDYRCSDEPPPPNPCPYDLELAAADAETGLFIRPAKTTEGRVDQRVVAVRPLETGTAFHAINVSIAVPESFEASDDLTSASVDGDVAGPWLSGDLSYVGPPASDGEDEECGPERVSSGLATGDYTAHFDSIGDVTMAPTGMSATVRRRI